MITWILQNGVTVLVLVGYVVFGVFSFMGYFNKDGKRQTESSKLADGLIMRLQQTVDQQTKDMTAMSTRIDDQQKEIHQLQGSNDAYLRIITLRDPETAKVFQEAPAIYELIRETHSNIDMLTKTLTTLIETIQPFVVHREAKRELASGV